MRIGVLLKSLKNIYDSSNFYKEARIVSFLDRLLQCVTGKIKQKLSLAKCIQKGVVKLEDIQNEVDSARQIVLKF
jgi:hypothetical protein